MLESRHPEEATDASLARRIAVAAPGVDAEAEAALYGRLAPRVRLYGLRHLREAAAAADLVQEVLLMTLEKLRNGEVKEPERIVSFVLGMCRMVVLDQRRGAARRARLLQTFAADLPPMAAEVSEPELDNARLPLCLNRLSARERAVLLLTFYDDRSAQAVAAELDLSEQNVRVIRHRALGKLRECMCEEGDEP